MVTTWHDISFYCRYAHTVDASRYTQISLFTVGLDVVIEHDMSHFATKCDLQSKLQTNQYQLVVPIKIEVVRPLRRNLRQPWCQWINVVAGVVQTVTNVRTVILRGQMTGRTSFHGKVCNQGAQDSRDLFLLFIHVYVNVCINICIGIRIYVYMCILDIYIYIYIYICVMHISHAVQIAGC